MDVQDTIKTLKDKMPDVTPTPPGWHPQATAHELKSRLNWGEPGLTIVDVRETEAFHNYRILGAMNMRMENLAEVATASIARDRDIYVYGANNQETAEAANVLRQAGFRKVAELQGGLEDWKAIDGPVEGVETNFEEPGADAYNVVSRLKEFSEEKATESHMK